MKKNLFFSLFLIVSVLLSIGFVSAGQADGRYIQNNISEVMTPAGNQFIGGTFLVTANVSAKATNHESTSFARFNITDMYVYVNTTDSTVSRLVAIVNCLTVGGASNAQCNATNWNYSLDTTAFANGNYTILVTFLNLSYNGTTSGAWNSSGMYVYIDNIGPNITINMTKANGGYGGFTSTTNYCINTNTTLINISGTVSSASTFGLRGMYYGNITILGSQYFGVDRTKSWVNMSKLDYPYFAFTNTSAFPPGKYILTLYANSTVNNTQIFGRNTSITLYVDTTPPTADVYAIWVSKTEDASSFCKPKSVGTEECTEQKYSYPFTVEPTEKITFHCGFTDSVSTMTYSYFVKKPGDTTFHNVLSDTTSTTLDYTDNVKSGDYLIYCVATDVCGNTTYISTDYENKALKFRVRSSEDYGPATGGDSGGSGTSTKTFAVDFSKTTEKTLTKSEGRILTLTFDGTTEHTVTIDEIMADSVTVTIRSEPVTVTVKKGETVNVDINKDGTEDLSLTLENIVNGQAMIKYTKLEAGATKIVAEESKPAQEETVTTTTTKIEVEEPTTKTGLWITIAIIVIGLVAYFVYAAKKR